MWFCLWTNVWEIEKVIQNNFLLSLQKLLGLPSLEDVLNPADVSSHFIVYNMTKVNKHGVVTLEDKTGKKICAIFKYHCLSGYCDQVCNVIQLNYMAQWFYLQMICLTGFCQPWSVLQTVSIMAIVIAYVHTSRIITEMHLPTLIWWCLFSL